MRRVAIVVLLVSVLSGGRSASTQDPSGPFTPQVRKFVRIYNEAGGSELDNWVDGASVSEAGRVLESFDVADGMVMELVAAEPVVRQPVDIHFDAWGRLWVVQYLQYPFPAGVSVRQYDQYLRARFTGVPAAPPNHVRGADKITVLEDTDRDGTFDSHRDVISGLNIATSVLTGQGGLWVMNPPYLLFYPDVNADGLPDGDSEVRLEGFGLEDTHAVANSLTWGPDGWLYGVHGSTSTATVRGVSFRQGVWRYHPQADRFELFAEGGGNLWTLSFDSQGRAFSGDNGGNSRGFHWAQGGRYEKNWPKHGPFAKPHSYGFFPHMTHEGYSARFAMTSAVYEDGELPGYEGQLIAGMALTSRVQASRFVADGSTVRTVDTKALVTTSDRSFRPVDTAVGPDGAVYFADWCDIRMNHVDPRDTWDKSCGRIWRLRPSDQPVRKPVVVAERSDAELVALLGSEGKWIRAQARRTLADRRASAVVPELRRMAVEARGQVALEAFWTAAMIDQLEPEWALALLRHPDAAVRSWTVRLLGDNGTLAPTARAALLALAERESDVSTRSQLASTAGRLDVEDALPLLARLMRHDEDVSDPHIPLLLWWALERALSDDAEAVLAWLGGARPWDSRLFREHLAERVARRLAAERGEMSYGRIDADDNWMEYARYPRRQMPGGKGDYTEWESHATPEVGQRTLMRLVRFMEMAPDAEARGRLLAGIAAGLEQGPPVRHPPDRLLALVTTWWDAGPRSRALAEVATRLGRPMGPAAERVGSERNLESGVRGTEAGQEAYGAHCAPCHQTDGRGMERLAVPLRGSPWVLGPESSLAHIVIDGLQGDMLMPSMGTLDDAQLAAILSYIRTAWGHDASQISPATIQKVRRESPERNGPWTRDELAKLRDRP